jgi:hypothetical protein
MMKSIELMFSKELLDILERPNSYNAIGKYVGKPEDLITFNSTQALDSSTTYICCCLFSCKMDGMSCARAFGVVLTMLGRDLTFVLEVYIVRSM